MSSENEEKICVPKRGRPPKVQLNQVTVRIKGVEILLTDGSTEMVVNLVKQLIEIDTS